MIRVNSDTVKARTIDFGGGCEVQHCVEIYGWFGIWTLAHQSGPHGGVNCGEFMSIGHGDLKRLNLRQSISALLPTAGEDW